MYRKLLFAIVLSLTIILHYPFLNFLHSQIVEEDGPEESLTSKEFDRFLAERAAAADSLPTITSQTGSSTATPRPKKPSKKEEDSLMAL